MASTKDINLQRNWRGSDHVSTVKKVGPYYDSPDSNSSVGRLVVGSQITYIDSMTRSYLRAAIRFPGDQNVYYTLIDNLVKPKTNDRNFVPLSPSSFGLSNRTFNSPNDYYTAVQNGLNTRSSDQIDGELFDYLYELLNFAKTGQEDYEGIDLSGFPWGQIQSFYAEVIGPIYSCRTSLLSRFAPEGLGSAKIYIAPDSEKLYDYKLITGTNEYLISAKAARGFTNQIKPQFVLDAVRNTLPFTLKSSIAYKVLEELAATRGQKATIWGPFYAWKVAQTTGELSDECIADVIANYTTGGEASSKKISQQSIDSGIWEPFVKKYLSNKVTNKMVNRKRVSTIETTSYGDIRFKCEHLIENWSKSGTQNNNLKSIFNEYLSQSRVLYVKMGINKTSGKASFSADGGSGSSLINNLYLRTSNSSPTRTADRIGFQVS